MSLSYEVTNWENGKTVLKAEHLRKIEKGITDIIAENDAIYKDEDTRKSNEKQRQEEHSRKMNEVSEVVSDIQKDYDSLQKIIIDENASANLQNQINQTNSQLEHIANKGTTVEVLERVTKEEIDRQIADGTLANLMIEDNSITEDKIKSETITIKSLAPGIFDANPKVLSINATMKTMGRFRYMVQIKTNGERTRKAYIKFLAKINSGNINTNTGIGVSLYANATDNLASPSYGIIHGSSLINKKSITKLGEYVEYECEYIIPDNIEPAD